MKCTFGKVDLIEIPFLLAATSDNNAFTCVPPSIHVLQPPSTSLYSAGKVNDAPQAPFRVPSSNDPIWASTEESATLSSPYVSESSDNEDGEPKCAWYSIYEGRTKEVSVCNLTPGQTFQFRVRATSCRTNAPGQNASRKNSSNPVFWGCASESLLKVTTPAVPPINPPSNLRLFGRPKPTGIRLTWDPPTSNGGAPILSYEVWQSLCDPISGSPIKLPSPKNASPMVTVSSESMQDLHSALAQHSSPPALSAPSSVSSSPLHQSGKAPNSRLVFSGGENSCEISGLHSGQSFAFRVRARNSTGWSDWSEWCTFSTAPSPPGEPSGPPRVKPTSATSVAVSWERVEQTNGAEITEYRVEWQPNVVEPSETCTPPERDQVDLVLSPTENSVNGSKISASSSSTCPPTCPNDGFQLVYSGGECHFELHDLQPASRIAFRVCAVNSAGAGKWSPLGGCVMPASRPGQPSGLALDRSAVSPTGEAETCVGGVSMTTARLVWIVPVDNGCPITSTPYFVFVSVLICDALFLLLLILSFYSYNLELTRYNGHISQASLTTVSGNSGTKQFPLCVDGGDLIPVSPEPLSLEDECKADGGDVGGCDLRNVLCISGSPSLLSSSSSSLSPIPSVGVEPGSAPSSNVSSESGRPRHHHALSRPSSLKARHLAPGGGRAVEYVRYKLTGLDIGAKYRVRVQALNAVGVSPFSGILHFSTLPQLPPPPTLCCVGSTAGSIKLRWSASSPDSAHDDSDDGPSKPRPSTPPANIKYVLEMSKKPESKGWVTVFEGPQTSFKARKLTEATLYYFRVAAVNVSGKGAFSEVISEKTAYLHPPPVDAPQVVEVDCTACKLQWPALNSIGQDPLIYLVHLTQVPSAVSASIESEEDAVTVYRGAETSCTITNLSPGRNYIARVCAIRCCQKETVDDQSLTPPKTTLQCNNRDIDQDADASQLTLPTHASTSCSPKITLLHGPFSVGTAFTTLAQKQTPVGQLINSLWCRTPFTREQSTFPLPTLHFRRPNLTSHLATLTAWVHRARASAAFRRLIIRPATSSRDRAQRRMACLLVVGFVLFTLLCAWFANQFLLKFSDESPAVRWPGGGALEDSSSSARAALYATRGRQHHQP
ncbi:unnamed protein product [Mesocestoides corti]|uniref:Fibronectin type-III domain-containing protein n=1 Tax=Mesocestoides corti TaxID=53468 RepID=A0A0R3U7K6_MESCO|nr:unnamed protein product [Mesocestoides corti]